MAIGLLSLDILEGEIAVRIVIVKLSPVGEDPEGPIKVDIELVDDRGEHHRTSWDAEREHYGLPIRFLLALLPKGFVYTLTFLTDIPSSVHGHIKTIYLNGQEVNLVEFDLGKLEDLENVISFGQEMQVSKWLTLKPMSAVSETYRPENYYSETKLEINVRIKLYAQGNNCCCRRSRPQWHNKHFSVVGNRNFSKGYN